jgi:hypothetical protein
MKAVQALRLTIHGGNPSKNGNIEGTKVYKYFDPTSMPL